MIPGQSQQFFEAAAAQAGGYEIERSLRFNSGDSAYLNRTPSVAGNRRTWTWSGWIKRSAIANHTIFAAGGTVNYEQYGLNINESWGSSLYDQAGSDGYSASPAGVLRDVSAWYHIVVAFDTTQATASDRIKLYLNGVLQVNTSSTYPAQNYEGEINNTTAHTIGRHPNTSQYYTDAYLAEIHFVDGQQLSASDFGEDDSNNVWQPKEYTGTYGTNGFYLKFDDTSSAAALGTDSSGNNNTWTVNNFLINSPQYDTSAITSVGTSGSNTLLEFTNNTNFDEFAVSTIVGGYRGTGTFTTTKTSNSSFNQIFSTSTGGRWTTQDEANASFTCRFFFSPPVAISSNVTYTIEGHYDGQAHYMTFYNDTGGSSSTWAGTGGSQTQSFSGNLAEMRLTGSIGGNAKPIVLYGVKFDNVIPDLTSPNIFDIDLAQIVSKAPSNTPPSMVVTGPTSNFSNGDVLTIEAVVGDDMIDSPTDYEAASGNNGGNYATLNPLDKASTQTVSDGSLQLNINQALPTFATTKTTFGISSGKFYWEFIKEASSSFGTAISGIWPTDEISPTLTTDLPANIGSYTDLLGFGVTGGNVQFRMMPSGNVSSGSYTEGQVIGIAFDANAGKFYAFINGSEISGQDIDAGTSVFDTVTVGKTYVPFGYNGNGGSGTENVEMTFNFGQRAYVFPPGGTGGPPSDYKSVCTTNLTDPTIAEGALAMSATTYQGNNTFPRSITGLGFSPDFVWTKVRSQAYRHMLFDTVRGTGKNVTSNSNAAETTDDEYGYISAFNSDGWTIAAGSISGENFNANGDDYVAWSWDAGTSTTSNTDGSITSSVRVNASAGFSIVSYTGSGTSPSTIGHGLNAVPEMILVKNRSDSWNWAVYHKGLIDGSTVRYLILNSNSAQVTGSGHWQNTVPSSSVFTVGNDDQVNAAVGTDTYIAYCFAPVEGFSAFGSYTGNGSTDGVFVYTGFRPKFVLGKRTDSTGAWWIYDTERSQYNEVNSVLLPNSGDQEITYPGDANIRFDILSNGFKHRNASSSQNASGGTYIYAAFAEHPFKAARAR